MGEGRERAPVTRRGDGIREQRAHRVAWAEPGNEAVCAHRHCLRRRLFGHSPPDWSLDLGTRSGLLCVCALSPRPFVPSLASCPPRCSPSGFPRLRHPRPFPPPHCPLRFWSWLRAPALASSSSATPRHAPPSPQGARIQLELNSPQPHRGRCSAYILPVPSAVNPQCTCRPDSPSACPTRPLPPSPNAGYLSSPPSGILRVRSTRRPRCPFFRSWSTRLLPLSRSR